MFLIPIFSFYVLKLKSPILSICTQLERKNNRIDAKYVCVWACLWAFMHMYAYEDADNMPSALNASIEHPE